MKVYPKEVTLPLREVWRMRRDEGSRTWSLVGVRLGKENKPREIKNHDIFEKPQESQCGWGESLAVPVGPAASCNGKEIGALEPDPWGQTQAYLLVSLSYLTSYLTTLWLLLICKMGIFIVPTSCGWCSIKWAIAWKYLEQYLQCRKYFNINLLMCSEFNCFSPHLRLPLCPPSCLALFLKLPSLLALCIHS